VVGILLVFLTINYQFRFLRGPATSQSGTVGLFFIFIPNIWPFKTIMNACFEFNTFSLMLLQTYMTCSVYFRVVLYPTDFLRTKQLYI